MPDLAGIQATGATLRGQVAVARAQLNTIDAQLAAAARIGADDAVALDSQTQQLKRDRVAAGAQRDAAVGELHDTIGDLISQLDPASALGALDATLPVALLPVRLETRFNPDKPTELLVRILPDDIHGHSHEPECTADEMVAGKRYWETVWSSPTTEPDATLADRAAWSDLAARVGLNRAAWLVRVLTPANLGTRPQGTPTFPEVALKGQAWTRAAWTTTMPDRWVVMAYRAGARIATAWGGVVPEHVHMGPDPSAAPPSVSVEGRPRVDDGLQWVIDFGAAEKIGLGVRVSVPAEGGLDRVIAFGVRGSLAPDTAAARLGDLFDAHHYTRGLSVVPQGTPTNNTPSDRAGWTSRPTPAAAFDRERRPAPLQPKSAGIMLAEAFGVDAATFATIENGALDEQSGAASMAVLIFEVTLGYYLDQLMQGFDASTPGPSEQNIAQIRRHFIDHVRGRGSLPALRVGNQPYGVLPVTSLQRWQPFDEDATTRNLPAILRAAQLFWRAGASAVPHLGGSSDVDVDFVHALTLQGRSQTLNVRTAQSPTFCRMTNVIFSEQNAADPCAAAQEIADATWTAFDVRGGLLGHAFHPRLADMVLGKDAPMLRLPLVAGTPGPESYLETLRTASLAQLSTDATHVSTATSLLATLARHAVLLAYGAAADALGRRSLTPAPSNGPTRTHLSAEMFGVSAQVAQSAPRFSSALLAPPLAALATPVAAVTGTRPAGDFLRESLFVPTVNPIVIELLGTLREIDGALADLSKRPAGELEGLMMETLDTVSHRFDAWVTSLAERRLGSLRARKPTGVAIGGYGWVENLQRRPLDPLVDAPQGETGPLRADVNGGGFIHAPTLNQAAAAGVLRSAHLSHAGTPSDGALAIDLSSRRVCLAMELLDGVRAGQPLGALLGYRLERNLHEGHAPLELDRYIAPLRRLAPLVANSVTAPRMGESLEAIAARNVVDGLALVKLPRTDVRANLVANMTPAATTSELDAVMGEIDRTMDAVAALSDLMLGESVYQVIQGNTARAGMTVDAINRGAVLPDPDVVRTHRSGTALAHRLLALVSAKDRTPASGWHGTSPRAIAEPRLDTWAGRLLGDPARVRMRASFANVAAAETPVDVTLAGVLATGDGMTAIDVLYDSNAGPGSVSSFESRLVARLAKTPPPGAPASFATVTLQRGRDAAWGPEIVSFEEFVTFAASVRALVVGGRAVLGPDLGRPEDSPVAGVDTADLAARATTAETALRSAIATATALLAPVPSADEAALFRASDALAAFGLLPPGARLAHAELLATMTAAANARIAKLTTLRAAPRPATDPAGDYDLAILAETFGGDFRTLPVIVAPNAAVLAKAFAASTALQRGNANEAWRWLRRIATVRAPAARVAEAMLFANVLGTGNESDLRVAQVPFDPGATWIGIAGPLPKFPTTGIVAHIAPGVDFAAGVVGLYFDEWSEVVPLDAQTTGVSFQAATPGARAPQSVLLAVSPDPSKPWDLETFEAILNETFDLAQQRMVDLDTLPWLGHFLPAIYIADSALDTTIGVHFKNIVMGANEIYQTLLVQGG